MSARLFLVNGNRVYGIEPNREIREAGELLLAGYPRFVSIDATARQPPCPRQRGLHHLGAGPPLVRPGEGAGRFVRILKPGGWVVLMWNERRVSDTLFLRNYERLLKTYRTDYAEVVITGASMRPC